MNTPRPIGASRPSSANSCYPDTKYQLDHLGEIHSWERSNSTFSNLYQPPRTSFVNLISADNDDYERRDKSSERSGISLAKKSMSSTAVQVSMFHCADCRNHIKYGNELFLNKSDDESDSESSRVSGDCISCSNLDLTWQLKANKLCKKNCPDASSPNCFSDEEEDSSIHPLLDLQPTKKVKAQNTTFATDKEELPGGIKTMADFPIKEEEPRSNKFTSDTSPSRIYYLITGIVLFVIFSIYLTFSVNMSDIVDFIPLNLKEIMGLNKKPVLEESWSDIIKNYYKSCQELF